MEIRNGEFYDEGRFLEYSKRRPFFRDVFEWVLDNPVKTEIQVKYNRFMKAWVGPNHNPPVFLSADLNQDERVMAFLHEFHHIIIDKDIGIFCSLEQTIKAFPDLADDIKAYKKKIQGHDSGVYKSQIDEWYRLIRENHAGEIDFMAERRFKTLRDALYLSSSRSRFKESHEILHKLFDLKDFAWHCTERFYTFSAKNMEKVLQRDFPLKYLEIQNRISNAYSMFMQNLEIGFHNLQQ